MEKDGKAMDVTCKIDDTSCITDKYYLLDNNDTKTFQKVNDTATVTKGAEDKGTGYAVTANGTTSYVVYGTTTYTMTAYDTKIENGYVKVSENATNYAAKYETAFKVPAKGSNNGTGYTYVVGTDTKFVAYGGTIPAADVKADIVLTKDQIKVTYTGFKTAASNKVEYKAHNASITVPAGAGEDGTGAEITGISGTKYAAYNGSVTAGGSDVTIDAGYVKVTVTSSVDSSGATTNAAGATLTAAAKAGEPACVKAGEAASYKVTITVADAATSGAVNVLATAPAAGVTVTPAKMPATAEDATFDVTVALEATATANDVTITLKVTE